MIEDETKLCSLCSNNMMLGVEIVIVSQLVLVVAISNYIHVHYYGFCHGHYYIHEHRYGFCLGMLFAVGVVGT